MFFLALAIFAFTTSACSGGGSYDAYQALGERVAHRAEIGNQSVVLAVSNLRCPAGMIATNDSATVQSQATINYQESHGGYGNGSRSVYGTYSGANVRVEADAGARAGRQVSCVIDLTPAKQ